MNPSLMVDLDPFRFMVFVSLGAICFSLYAASFATISALESVLKGEK